MHIYFCCRISKQPAAGPASQRDPPPLRHRGEGGQPHQEVRTQLVRASIVSHPSFETLGQNLDPAFKANADQNFVI